MSSFLIFTSYQLKGREESVAKWWDLTVRSSSVMAIHGRYFGQSASGSWRRTEPSRHSGGMASSPKADLVAASDGLRWPGTNCRSEASVSLEFGFLQLGCWHRFGRKKLHERCTNPVANSAAVRPVSSTLYLSSEGMSNETAETSAEYGSVQAFPFKFGGCVEYDPQLGSLVDSVMSSAVLPVGSWLASENDSASFVEVLLHGRTVFFLECWLELEPA